MKVLKIQSFLYPIFVVSEELKPSPWREISKRCLQKNILELINWIPVKILLKKNKSCETDSNNLTLLLTDHKYVLEFKKGACFLYNHINDPILKNLLLHAFISMTLWLLVMLFL